MDVQIIVGVITPFIIIVLMWGVGLSLTFQDFDIIRKNPKLILVAIAVQLILVPLFAFSLNWMFGLTSSVAIGMILLASTPGGTTANIFSYLSKGNVALNVTLTAINTIIGIFSIPLFIYLAYFIYQKQGTVIPLQFGKILQVLLVLLIPMTIGIATRTRYLRLAQSCEKYVSKLSFLAILFLLGAALYNEKENLGTIIRTAGWPVVSFNLFCLGIGIIVSKAMKMSRADESALVMELGIHNCILALGIAYSPTLLNDTVAAMPAAIYIVFMYITALPLAYWYRKKENQYRSL